jgi:hypothetical protein
VRRPATRRPAGLRTRPSGRKKVAIMSAGLRFNPERRLQRLQRKFSTSISSDGPRGASP